MYIEDLIYQLYINCKLNKYDSAVIFSFVGQNSVGNGFTEKQSALAIKILRRYSNSLSAVLQKDITQFLDQPIYRHQIRKINQIKSVSIVDNETFARAIKLVFPYNQEKIEFIRKNKSELGHAQWDNDQKAWLFSLEERNIKFIQKFIENDDYDLDEEFKNYLEQIQDIISTMEKYVPMLVLKDNQPEYANVSAYVPKLQSKDIISALFEARKHGIFTWNEEINNYLNEINLDPVLRTFLSNENPDHLEINSLVHPITCLTQIIKHTQPVLFIIPGGSELEKTKMIYDFLKGIGIDNQEISVLFRLPNSDGREFNDFVKNCGLNNPISEKTHFVFVSIKLPKPLIRSKIKFNSVISLGRSNVHYTIQDFYKNRQNLIYYCEPARQKDFNFEFL